MKKTIFLFAMSLLAATIMQAQIKTEIKPTVKLKTVQPLPPPPPPAPTNKGIAPGTTPAAVYSLTGARVTIKTGTDNKEFLSDVTVSLWNRSRQSWNYTNDCYYKTPTLKTEMAVNSNTDLGLDKYPGSPEKLSLANVQAGGLELIVSYQPNILLDAWKIENISLVLEFRDQNGNLHPTLGNKTISFSSAIGFLNAEYRAFKCTTDPNFNPLTAAIGK